MPHSRYHYEVELGRPTKGVYLDVDHIVVGDLKAFDRRAKQRGTDAWAYNLIMEPPFSEHKHFCVKRTTLVDPQTGKRYPFKGLFARKSFKKGDYLLTYMGPHVTDRKAIELQQTSCYLFDVKIDGRRRFVIDGNDPNHSSISRFTNSLTQEQLDAGLEFNASFTNRRHDKDEPIIFLRAERPIKAGEEIFTWYGAFFDLAECVADQTPKLAAQWARAYRC